MVTQASRERLNLAKEVSLIGLIKELGGKLEETGGYYRMISPFRSENIPSFFINKRNIDKWKDMGTGHHGDTIDFVQELFNLSKHDAINYLLKRTDIPIPEYKSEQRDHESIEICHIGAIISPLLIQYLTERQIGLKTAEKYLVELEIKFPYGKYPDRISRVLGFKNDAGGYEMRSKFLKIGNSPKTVTTIKGFSHECINLYEGFFSFLSDCELRGSIDQPCDAVILNTLAFLPQMLSFWGKDVFIYSHLDHDNAGNKATQLLRESEISFHDMRCVYNGFNDLNDYICDKPIPVKKSILFPKY